MRQVGDVIKIKARGEVREVEGSKISLDLKDVQDTTEEEIDRMSDKDGILADEDLALIFGED